MSTVYVILLVLALLSSWFILWHVPLIEKENWAFTERPTISVIIPARNEEGNLPILLKSLAQQTLAPDEILVVDDDSEDQTAKIAIEYEATVLTLRPDEKEWVGKSAACWAGAEEAQGEVFIFLDADIFLPRPDSLENIIQTFMEHEKKGVLSIQPFHIIQKPYENLSAIFNILVLAGMNRFSILKDRIQPAGAFGPSLITTKETYFHVGGHKRVKDAIMENIDLGKTFLEAGYPVHLYGGKGNLHFRMYPEGLSGLAQGWSKSFASGSQSTHPLIMLGTSLWIAGAFITLFAPLYFLAVGKLGIALFSLGGYLLYASHFYRIARLTGQFHFIAILLYPILFIYFVALFGVSVLKTYVSKEVLWKGRKIKT